jgi:DNA-binding transcriptional LysR family regulator
MNTFSTHLTTPKIIVFRGPRTSNTFAGMRRYLGVLARRESRYHALWILVSCFNARLSVDIRRLKFFIVTAEERNIGRAAERLHITQPPLTRHIQSLEEELGVQLFRRTSAGVELTQAGTALLTHAQNISAHVELATEQIRRVAAGKEGRIDIGIFGSAMLDVIPRLLSIFSQACPHANVVLHNAPKDRQLEALQQGRITIAFDRYFRSVPGLQSELVSQEALWFAVNRRNPLAQKTSITMADLRVEPLIGEQDQSVFFASQELFRLQNFNPVIVHKAADMISAVVMVAGGFGSSLGASLGAQPETARRGFCAAGARDRVYHRPALRLPQG